MRTFTKTILAVSTVAVLSFAGIAGVNALTGAASAGESDGLTVERFEPAASGDANREPAPVVAPVVEPVPVVTNEVSTEIPQESTVSAPVVEYVEPAPYVPTLCPGGTTAGAVDDMGNESSCYPLNDQQEVCGAYEDFDGDGVATDCTNWYKP